MLAHNIEIVHHVTSTIIFSYRAPRSQVGSSWGFVTFYQTIVYFGVSLVIPTLIMVFVTYNLIGSLDRVKKRKSQMTTGTNQSGTAKGGSEDLTLTLIIVVVVFVLCNMFNPVRRAIVGKYGDTAGKCPHFMYPFTSLNSTIHIFNASVNFTIYVLCGKTFRKRVKNLVLCRTNKVGYLGSTDPNTGSKNDQSLKF